MKTIESYSKKYTSKRSKTATKTKIILRFRSSFGTTTHSWRNSKGKILFIGINPAYKRDPNGDFWQSRVGKFLAESCSMAGFRYRSVAFTNLYGKPTFQNRPLTTKQQRLGFKKLSRKIQSEKPKVLVLMGKTVIQKFGYSKYGILNDVKFKLPTYGVYHPSYSKRFNKQFDFVSQLRVIKNTHERQIR